MKECKKCQEVKPLSEFYKHKGMKDGYRNECKSCSSEIKRQCRIKNADHYKEYEEKRKQDKNRIASKKEIDKAYYKKNRDKINEKKKLYYENNREHFLEVNKQWRDNHKEFIREYDREYRKKYSKNPKRIAYNKEYRNRDLVKLREGIRTLIRSSINSRSHYVKDTRTEEILGCTIEEFILYLQSKFKEGMTLENRSEWHIDHIIPISSAKTYEEVIKLNHYTNLQPLWAEENLRKSNKM